MFFTRKIVDPFAPKYGTFTNRMLASTIDVGILFIIAGPIIDFLTGKLFSPIDANSVMAVLSSPDLRGDPGHFIVALWNELRAQHVLERAVIENILEFILIAGYTLPFWFRYSSTPGKMLFRLEIQDAKTGERMSRRQSVIRFLGYIVSTIPFTLGFIWVVFNRKRQAIHDIIAGTVVVVKPKNMQAASVPQEPSA